MRKGIFGLELLKWWDRTQVRQNWVLKSSWSSSLCSRKGALLLCSTLTDYERFLLVQSGAGIEVKEKGEKKLVRTQDCDSSRTC